ncbi:hypothetical protein BJV82DRAFT_597937 [Fennellomyces sp. T-0311]|nr:hypothetical protein BJV82DRAFT_597937 [Fennellomyces sp. T-0311]
MLEIPGYYFDPVKNRYFKITANGPHSLVEIRKAQEEAERQKVKAEQRLRFKPPARPNTLRDQNVLRYLHSRRMRHSFRPAMNEIIGTRAVYKHLHTQSQFSIPGSSLSRACCMDFYDGDAVVCYPQGCPMRFKYQCEPFFSLLDTPHLTHVDADVTSLHVNKRRIQYQDEARRPVFGTTELSRHSNRAQLWRLSLPPLPEIDPEFALCLREHQQSQQLNVPVVIGGLPEDAVAMDCTFALKLNNFWTCSVDEVDETLVVGCDTGAYMLTSTFNVIGRANTKTAVLAAQHTPQRPGLAWLGCRDSEIKLFDPRSHYNHNIRFKHSSLAIAHLAALDPYRILALDVGDSMALWDVRFVSKRTRPVQRFRGHKNRAGTQVAFDVDLDARLVALAGDDHRVRLWSLAGSAVDPFWESQQFGDGPIQAIKFVHDPPPIANVWKDMDSIPSDVQSGAPGLIVAAPVNGDASSSGIHWLSV